HAAGRGHGLHATRLAAARRPHGARHRGPRVAAAERAETAVSAPTLRRAMRAFVLTAPRECSVQDVPAAVAAPGDAVVNVERVGVCGTDVEFFTGEMAYLHEGHARFPMRLGHEWAGTVSAVGDG